MATWLRHNPKNYYYYYILLTEPYAAGGGTYGSQLLGASMTDFACLIFVVLCCARCLL
jgi:hypothetical protein